MPVSVRYITDPACDASWAIEPQLRKLIVEFGDDVAFTYVMGGLAREFEPAESGERLVEWLERAAEGGMPLDPLLWVEGPIRFNLPGLHGGKGGGGAGSGRPTTCDRCARG